MKKRKEVERMADKKRLSAEQQKKLMAEEMWLHYFNQSLFIKGVITEAERNRIANMIAGRGMSGKHVM